jgi:glucan phosphoethanolaminetransferase (alkaline phosphatase superfamily)
MSDRTLRFLIASAIALLLIFQIGTLIAGLFGVAWGVISGAVVTLVSFVSARLARAGGRSSLWFLLPTLLFTVIPIALMIWNLMTQDATWFDRIVRLTPFMVGFGIPIVLLLVVYFELRSRTLQG